MVWRKLTEWMKRSSASRSRSEEIKRFTDKFSLREDEISVETSDKEPFVRLRSTVIRRSDESRKLYTVLKIHNTIPEDCEMGFEPPEWAELSDTVEMIAEEVAEEYSGVVVYLFRCGDESRRSVNVAVYTSPDIIIVDDGGWPEGF